MHNGLQLSCDLSEKKEKRNVLYACGYAVGNIASLLNQEMHLEYTAKLLPAILFTDIVFKSLATRSIQFSVIFLSYK